MTKPQPVLLIGLDAADQELIQRLSDAGELPTLARLRDRGLSGSLQGCAGRFAGGVWPTFYTGRDVPWHGLYHNKIWRQERMQVEVADESWFPQPPFWELLDRQRYRIAVLDVPMTVALPKPLNGVHLAGWGTHDVIARGSWPGELWSRLAREFGPPAMPAELFGAQTPRTLKRLTSELIAATEQMGAIGAALLEREPWDLFLLVFGATHRGGHYLWDLSQIERSSLSEGDRQSLERALSDVYRACDQALGRVLSKAPPDARVLVFAVHGMGPNTTWADRVPDMLQLIQSGGSGEKPKRGALYRIKQMLPWPLIRVVTSRLPQNLQSRLVKLWSKRMFDWSTTRAFPVPMDHAGYIRFNLQGREPEGIVRPGAEYDALCAELTEGFMSFRDIESGRPIVRCVYRQHELASTDAPARDRLPDLVIEWDSVSPIESKGIVSHRFGELRWSPAGKLSSGRAGNHRAQGWFIAAGDGIGRGRVEGHTILDLVPTACEWLGAGLGAELQGRPIQLSAQ
jgi:predicted AlkP superfamily phosphohydrolase/phosphomutase